MEQEIKEKEVKQALTGLLFSVEHGLTLKKMGEILEADVDLLRKIIKEIDRGLEEFGLCIIKAGGNYQLVTNPKGAFYVKKFFNKEAEKKLNRAALEVLAVIAYREGATREEIELIRGVNSGQALRVLTIKGLIVKKINNNISRYEPALKFLRLTGLQKITDLPGFLEFKNDSRVQEFLNS